MADGVGALEIEGAGAVLSAENVADKAGMPLRSEVAVVIGDDACGFLSAMLKSVQPQDGQRTRIRMAEYAENATLLVECIPLKVLVLWKAGHGLPLPPLPVASRSLSSA